MKFTTIHHLLLLKIKPAFLFYQLCLKTENYDFNDIKKSKPTKNNKNIYKIYIFRYIRYIIYYIKIYNKTYVDALPSRLGI